MRRVLTLTACFMVFASAEFVVVGGTTVEAQTRSTAVAPAPGSNGAQNGSQRTTIPSGDLISVRMLQEIGSRISVEGDTFGIVTLEDYYAMGKLVLPKGSPGYGVVTHIKRAGTFHAGGELTFVIKRLIAPDHSDIMVETNGATADADKTSEKNGNEVGAYLLLGVGGLFGRRGNDLQIKRGATFHVATVQERDVPVVPYGTEPAKMDETLVTPQR